MNNQRNTKLKFRLDQLVYDKGLSTSREKAKALIMTGNVLVNGQSIDKPGTSISHEAEISLKGDGLRYVSRGGLKLEKALSEFKVDVTDLICLDIGASTGGFTDCLLQNKARKVFAVDVGYGQLAWKLRQDQRVVVIERTNARYITEEIIPEKIDLVTIDASFISLKLLVPPALQLMKENSAILALIKPQFEAGKGKVGKGGVVRDPKLHEEIILNLQAFFQNSGLICKSVTESPILGPKGNKEFIIFLKKA